MKNQVSADFGKLKELSQEKELKHREDALEMQVLKGWKKEYKNAEDSEKINCAKLFLKQNNFNVSMLLNLEGFKDYDQKPDYKNYIRKFVNNSKSKKFKSGISLDMNSERSVSLINQEQKSQFERGSFSMTQETTFQQPAFALPSIQINNGAIINHESIITYIEKFTRINPLQRYLLLSEIVQRNTQSLFLFLQYLEKGNESILTSGMFSLLNELILNSKDLEDDSKSRIFLASLNFYKGEQLQVDDQLIKDSMQLLVRSPNMKQALGLANYVVFNECECFSKQEELLKKLDASNLGVFQLMFATWNIFQVDHQVLKLIPWSFFVLNIPFIHMLKYNSGLALIRDIPSVYTEHFVQICAFSTAPNVQALKDYIALTRSTFLQKQEMLDQRVLTYFMENLSLKLRQREPSWIGMMEEIKRLQQHLVMAQIEKGVAVSNSVIDQCLKGDFSEIQRILQLPRALEQLSETVVRELIHYFESKNNKNEMVLAFSKNGDQEKLKVSELLEKVQTLLGFKLYASQLLCLNFISENLYSNHFIQFGIGNGKTLLSITLAILLATETQKSVFIVSKNEHLVQRDIKKYEKLMQSMNLNANLNQCSKSLGIYFYTQPQVKRQFSQSKFEQIWKDSFLIVDEYDWILFDGSSKGIVENLQLYSKAHKVIGFSGSELSIKEVKCLDLVFQSTPVVFPSLDKLKGNKKTQRSDVLVSSNKTEYLQKIKDVIDANISYSPILIVAQETYQTIELGLSKCGYDLTCLSKNHAQVIEAIIEGRYLMKNQMKQYGVYLMNEAQGRGTDIQTNDEINSNGGSFLIIADVFTKRSEEQIIGRVGRLNTKGKWQRILYELGTKDSAEQLLFVHQNVLELGEDKKHSSVQSLLEEQQNQAQAKSMQQEQKKQMDVDFEEEKINVELKNIKLNQVYGIVEVAKVETMISEQTLEKLVKEPINIDGVSSLDDEKESKLGLNQPSLIETIVQKMKTIPQLEDKSDEFITSMVTKRFKANYFEMQKEAKAQEETIQVIGSAKTSKAKPMNKRVKKIVEKVAQQDVILRKSSRALKNKTNYVDDNDESPEGKLSTSAKVDAIDDA